MTRLLDALAWVVVAVWATAAVMLSYVALKHDPRLLVLVAGVCGVICAVALLAWALHRLAR